MPTCPNCKGHKIYREEHITYTELDENGNGVGEPQHQEDPSFFCAECLAYNGQWRDFTNGKATKALR